MITNNMAGWDRIARVLIAAVLLILSFGGFVTGGLGLVFKIIGVVFALTGIVGWCPIYSLFKFSTRHA